MLAPHPNTHRTRSRGPGLGDRMRRHGAAYHARGSSFQALRVAECDSIAAGEGGPAFRCSCSLEDKACLLKCRMLRRGKGVRPAVREGRGTTGREKGLIARPACWSRPRARQQQRSWSRPDANDFVLRMGCRMEPRETSAIPGAIAIAGLPRGDGIAPGEQLAHSRGAAGRCPQPLGVLSLGSIILGAPARVPIVPGTLAPWTGYW